MTIARIYIAACRTGIVSLLMCFFGCSLNGVIPVPESMFASGDEGWRVGDFFSAGGSGTATFVSTEGNPGGFIRTGDVFNWNAFHAPGDFLGDQSIFYGGYLHVDQRVLSSDDIDYPLVVISDGSMMLQFRADPPGMDWTSYRVPLLASSGWELADGSGDPGTAASEILLQQVLANLAFLHLDADWVTGSDQVDLDNVRFEVIPEPSKWGALLAGIVMWRVVALRRRKQ